MKNTLKRTIAALLAVTMLAVLVPHSAQAKDYTYKFKITTLNQKEWKETSKLTDNKNG